MNNVKRIIVDGDADIPEELHEKVVYVPQYVIFDGNNYKATKELIQTKMEEMLIPEKLYTSMPSVSDFEEGLKELTYPAIAIYVSSGISSACKSIEVAANNVGVSDQLYMFDTLTAAAGIGNYVYLASKLIDEGYDMPRIYDVLTSIRDRGKEKSFALVGDARFAVRGGRVSGLAARAANAMKFMVIVSPDSEGKLQVIHKTFGRKKAIKYIVDRTLQFLEMAKHPIVGISHAWSEKDALLIRDTLMQYRKDIEYSFVTYMNPTLVAHGGKGTLSVSVLDADY